MSPYELAVGLRYTRSRKGSGRNTFISFIALVSMAGIALGVAALIVVLSVMNGSSRSCATGSCRPARTSRSAACPSSPTGPRSSRSRAATRASPPRRPTCWGRGCSRWAMLYRGVIVRGVDPALEDTVADIGRSMRFGKLADLVPGEFGIVLGAELARALGLRVGDSAVLITPQGTVTPPGTLPRVRNFRVVGIFEVGM